MQSISEECGIRMSPCLKILKYTVRSLFSNSMYTSDL